MYLLGMILWDIDVLGGREPSDHKARLMIAMAVATSVVICMNNHYYSFGQHL